MTNEHVITKEMIESKEIINITYKYEEKWIQIKLDENKRFIQYYKDMDITIIEINSEDNIKKKYFLLPNINEIDYKDKDIYIIQFTEGKKLCYSEGKIKDIYNNELIYDASTKKGSSGSPILLKNTTTVIGIHKKGCISKKENHGTLIDSIMLLLNPKKKIYEDGDYYIGQFLNNLRHGKGKLFYENGNIKYEGDFVNDKYEGIGKYIFENGDYYIGQF